MDKDVEMGSLYVVSTPIGNMGDISQRALDVLQSVDFVAAEDTRHTKNLLNRFEISNKLISYHDYNKEGRISTIISDLKKGKDIAIVSDAGTPAIADPAFRLVREAIKEEIPVFPVPGASALLAALVASGLPTDRFVFENFAPQKPGKKESWLESLKNEKRTVIFYESPHKIIRTLRAMEKVYGNIDVVVAREITKIYEEFLRDNINDIITKLESKKIRGEFVVLFNLTTDSNNGL